MNTRVLAGVAVASVVLLASCMQDREATPLLPTQASYAKPSSGTCVALSTTNTNAKAYFAQPQDSVLAFIDSLYKYQALGDTANANVWGFKSLTRLALAANSPTTLVKGDSVQGNTVAKNLLGCMTVQGYADSISFISAFGKKGLFAVRSDSKRDPAISRFIVSGEGSLFGAEPSDSVPETTVGNVTTPVVPYKSWYARLNSQAYTGPILFYGYEVTPASTFNDETTVGTIYDLSALPRPLSFLKLSPNALDTTRVDSVPMLKAGVCSMTSDAGQILHEHGGETSILPQAGAPLFCKLTTPPSIGLSESPFSSFALATKRVVGWFAPQPLYAFGAFGGSGSYGGLSKGGPVTYDVVADSVTWYTAPARIRLSAQPQSPPISVRVVSTNGNPVAGVKVQLVVVGNFGSFTPPTDVVRYTAANGRATFNSFFLDKSGGYNITATASSGGTTYGSVTATINVTGK